MKQLLAAAGLLAVTVGAASAADMPVKAARSYTAAPAMTWNGAYAGLNVGYGWGRASATGLGVTGNEDVNGIVGGGQIGYNWQLPALPFIFGVEADIQGTDQHNSRTFAGVTFDDHLNYFGTVRGRLGYGIGQAMIYATGGWAYGELQSDVSFGGATTSVTNSRSGWTAGGGVEWMIMPKWSVKAEYLYIDTGSFNSSAFGVPFTARFRNDVARVGVNYHF